jgi:putative hydrolase of the HAD superfamily
MAARVAAATRCIMTLPRAILFDLDDTIISAYGRPDVAWAKVMREFAPRLGRLDPQQAAAAIAAYAKEFWSDPKDHRHWRHRLGEARRRIVATALPAADAALASAIADRFTALRDEEMHLFPGAVETLEELRRRDVRLALITNGDGETQRAKIVRFALAIHFDHIQIEGEHGFGKPEERAYRHALAALDVAAADTWMVGDNLEWEVAAPKRLGIHAIWYDAEGAGLPPDPPARPDRIITALPQLLPR